ncbi:hypothetical protein NM208_g7785 [Fusarium decemcellulare]|uniref:Uncharacterized protein n=1 Tax=Fusarium decemcellulare TaxID=57161 RepID=A0ACC1S7T1_9HYPO|nr:hypothetical protein NM208_g7785 [Fusarium decemcellulare]
MNFELPLEVRDYLSRLDTFINRTVLPIQHQDDNDRFFDYRREASRTQWNNGGLPAEDWENLLQRVKKLADQEGFYRFACPPEYGGSGSESLNLYMCAIRYYLASHPVYGGGVSLANDLQSEHSVVGNIPFVILIYHYGTPEQQRTLIPASIRGEMRATFGLTEIEHGSDATYMGTTAKPVTLDSGEAGPGVTVASYEWTLNMPSDHATVMFQNVRVPESAILGPRDNGLAIAQTFTHENRIRQAASSCGAAQYCIDKSVEYANKRNVFGKPLSFNQAIQWPLVELSTQAEMLRLLILRTAVEMDQVAAQAKAVGKAPWGGHRKAAGSQNRDVQLLRGSSCLRVGGSSHPDPRRRWILEALPLRAYLATL